jgi:hypothetical protein
MNTPPTVRDAFGQPLAPGDRIRCIGNDIRPEYLNTESTIVEFAYYMIIGETRVVRLPGPLPHPDVILAIFDSDNMAIRPDSVAKVRSDEEEGTWDETEFSPEKGVLA